MQSPWAILPEKLMEIRDIYLAHAKGQKIDLKEVEAKIHKPLENEQARIEITDSVAVIPIHGVLSKRMNMLSDISGGASTELIGQDLRQAIKDPEVKEILLDIDSPGGTVDGTAELATMIFEARDKKPITAFTDGDMTSAAYWIGAASSRVVISGDTTHVGSIGVIATHVDVSESEKQMGVKTTEITAGKFKNFGSRHEPLSKEGVEYFQEKVDYLYSVFVGEIAKFRGVSEDQVLKNMADAKIFIGRQAIEAGLVDEVQSREKLIGELSTREENIMLGKDVKAITSVQLIAENPDLYNEIKAAGRTEGIEEGARTERERIKGVMSKKMKGHEAIVEEMMFDGITTPPTAAERILNAEKGLQEGRFNALKKDAPGAVPHANIDPTKKLGALQEDAPVEDRTKAEWDQSVELRAEFGGEYYRYLAFTKANEAGRVKISKK